MRRCQIIRIERFWKISVNLRVKNTGTVLLCKNLLKIPVLISAFKKVF